MPLPFSHKKGAVVSYIIKKMNGAESYDRLKEYNEESPEHVLKAEKPQADMKPGYELAVQDMMQAVEQKDTLRFKSALKSFVKMCLQEEEANEEMSEKNSEY